MNRRKIYNIFYNTVIHEIVEISDEINSPIKYLFIMIIKDKIITFNKIFLSDRFYITFIING